MDIPSQPTLTENGWELAIAKITPPLQAKTGDLAQITIVAVAIDEADDPIRSVTHHPLWVEIKNGDKDNLSGVIKSIPAHTLTVKDHTTFDFGDTVFFKAKNIFQIRNKN